MVQNHWVPVIPRWSSRGFLRQNRMTLAIVKVQVTDYFYVYGKKKEISLFFFSKFPCEKLANFLDLLPNRIDRTLRPHCTLHRRTFLAYLCRQNWNFSNRSWTVDDRANWSGPSVPLCSQDRDILSGPDTKWYRLNRNGNVSLSVESTILKNIPLAARARKKGFLFAAELWKKEQRKMLTWKIIMMLQTNRTPYFTMRLGSFRHPW